MDGDTNIMSFNHFMDQGEKCIHFMIILVRINAIVKWNSYLFLKDKISWLVDHCFTSHYSSFCDVQIDLILHTLIILLYFNKVFINRLCAFDILKSSRSLLALFIISDT